MTGRRSLRFSVACCLAVSICCAGATVKSARADSLDDAKAKAAQLQSQVAALQTSAEQASEQYDAAESALGRVVVEQQQAIEAAEAASSAADAAQATIDSRTRALYMSGGTLGLYAAVLTGQDPNTLLSGLHSVQALSDVDSHTLDAIDSTASAAQAANAKVAALSAQQDALTASASSASSAVQQALAEQQAALDDSNAQVTKIEAALQAQIDAENAAAAAQALQQAQQVAVAAGFVITSGSKLALTAIAAAETQLGKPYVYGGTGPDSWDCSGLTQWAFGQAGAAIPRTAADQYAAIPTKVPLGELEPGDLLFWATDTSDPSSIHHVAIYLGSGMMLAAPHTGTVVQIQPVYLDGFIGAARIG
jgi:cell wall-associated NlpC family hydrolase